MSSSKGCESTNVEEWLTMTIVGRPSTVGTPECTTNLLDHPNIQDYAEGTIVTFGGSDDKGLLAGCYLVRNYDVVYCIMIYTYIHQMLSQNS